MSSIHLLTRRINSFNFNSIRTHSGYLPFEGRIPNNTSEAAVNRIEIKKINFKPVKRVLFTCDPCHPRANHIRRLMTTISAEKIVKTGPKTIFKYDFVTDRSEPSLALTFHDNDNTVIFKMAEMTEHEVIAEMNKIVLPLVKDEKEASKDLSGKKSGAKGKKK